MQVEFEKRFQECLTGQLLAVYHQWLKGITVELNITIIYKFTSCFLWNMSIFPSVFHRSLHEAIKIDAVTSFLGVLAWLLAIERSVCECQHLIKPWHAVTQRSWRNGQVLNLLNKMLLFIHVCMCECLQVCLVMCDCCVESYSSVNCNKTWDVSIAHKKNTKNNKREDQVLKTKQRKRNAV